MKRIHVNVDIAVPDLKGVAAFAHRWLLPNPGTLILVVVLLLTIPALASPASAPSASTATIPYQGRLADSSGTPITAMANMEFRLYDVPTGGVPLWEEMWTGGNAVSVSDGLFSVMLGSLNTGVAVVVNGHNELYLGITVGTDSEMTPRVQFGSVPFSMQALTMPPNSITTAMMLDGSVTLPKLGADVLGTLGSISDYDGYHTWLGTQVATGPGWTNLTAQWYRPVTVTVEDDALLDISWMVTLTRGGTGRAAARLLVNGEGGTVIGGSDLYTGSDKAVSMSDRVLLPVGPGTYTVEVQIGSWEQAQVTIDGSFSLNVVAYNN